MSASLNSYHSVLCFSDKGTHQNSPQPAAPAVSGGHVVAAFSSHLKKLNPITRTNTNILIMTFIYIYKELSFCQIIGTLNFFVSHLIQK